MITNARIADLIRENRPDEITDAVAEGDFFQMQTFQQALIELVTRGAVEAEVAANAASNRHDFLVALEREQKVSALGDTRTAEPEPEQLRAQTESVEGALGGLRLA